MADPFSDQDHGLSGASKRPAQTIEGTATEITEESAGGDAAREAEAAAGADRPDVAGEAANGVDAAPPPAQASLPELKSFVTHLAAGVLGGLVGVVGLALAWGGLGGGGSSGPQPDIAALEARIAKLETAPPAAGDSEALAQLKAQVEALETGVKETSPKLADLADRVGQLETSLKAISQSASDGGSVASAAAIAQQIAEAEQRLDAKIADALAKAEADTASTLQEMQSAIAELKAKIGALAELGTGDGAATGPALAALTERLAKLEAALPELAAAIGKENNGAKSAAAAIAFANLRAAVSDGRPYAAELDTISALVPSVGDLGVLPAYAEKGIPTVPDLTRSFAVAKEGA